jgi:hypothetical protein
MTLKKFIGSTINHAAITGAIVLFLIVFQGNSSTALAQSTGAFGGAIVDMVPTGTTINGTLSSGAAGAFLITGNVYQKGTTNCATVAAPSDALVNFASGATRLGTFRIWGYRLDPAQNQPVTNAATGQAINNITGGRVAVVNISLDLDSYNGTLQLQGTLGRVFGAIESTGHPLTDVLAIIGGTQTYRSASGDASLVPIVGANGENCANGGFQLQLSENPRLPRFGNIGNDR